MLEGFDEGRRWRPTAALARSILCAVVPLTIALIWRRPDLLVIATPFAAVTAWSLLTRPMVPVSVIDHLGHPTIREGDATTWTASVTAGSELDVCVAAFDDTAWIQTNPASGVATAAVSGSTASLEVAVRSLRWGRRSIDGIRMVAATPWAAFTWSGSVGHHSLTTLPVPAMFDAAASPRPSDGLVGMHRSARNGEGNEFAGIRAFHAGDRMRRINWPRSVRAGELQVNSTLADLDVHVALILDVSDDYGTSEGIEGRASSLDLTVRSAAAIAEHFAPRGERVSLQTFGASTDHAMTPGSGRAHVRRLLDVLARVQPAELVPTGRRRRLVGQLGAMGGQVTVMLSPLIEPHALDLAIALGRRGRSVIVIDTLPDDVAVGGDHLTVLAWRIRLLERRAELRSMIGAGIPVVAWRGPGSLDQVLRDIARRTTGPRAVRR